LDDQDLAHSQEITTLARGAGLVFIGTLCGLVLKYLFQLMVARHLGARLFGTFFLGVTVFSVLERISGLGLPQGVLRYVSVFRAQSDPERMKGTILTGLRVVSSAGLFLLVATMLSSSFLSTRFFHDVNLVWVVRILAVGGIFSGLTDVLILATQAFQVMQYKVIVRFIFEPIFRIVFVWVWFWLGWKLFGASLAFALASVLGTVLAFSFMRKVFPPFRDKRVTPRFETKKIFLFSWPLFFVGALNMALAYASILMLGCFRAAEEVGIFGASFRTAMLMAVILDSFNAIFPAIIADLFSKEKSRKMAELYKLVTKWIFTLVLPIFLVLVLFPKMILDQWGEGFSPGAICLILMACAQLINCAVGPSGYMLMMIGYTRIILINASTMFAMTFGLGMWLIPKHGILGAALSYAVPIGLINIVRLGEVFFLLRMHPYRWDFLKPLAAGLGAASIGWILKNLVLFTPPLVSLGVRMAMVGTVYFLVITLLKIPREDKIVLGKIKEKLVSKS
jgi:O-antigen/teichoic acid export membrane protein